ncbi:ArsR family transcriptional regulator [Halobacteria archaeon AArc-dxtr1]|nr:ArsR family transcriptional regulator [Halobacteria archaeon AArc-dxtr1]
MSSNTHFGGDSTRRLLNTVPAKCYDVLRDRRRLHLLEVLGAAACPLSVDELTRELHDRDDSADEQSLRISLVHAHLPKLDDVGLVEWDGEEATLANESAVPPQRLMALLDSDASSDRVLDALVHPDRMAILSLLEERNGSCAIETIAAELALLGSTDASDPREAKVMLHHSHLPAMRELGVLTYDSGMVRTTDHPVPVLE